MSDSIDVETAFSCDFCGALFNSPQEAQRHNKEIHTEENRGLSTSTPAEEREGKRASQA